MEIVRIFYDNGERIDVAFISAGVANFIYGFVAQAYHIKTVVTWGPTGEAPLCPRDQRLTIY